MMGMAACRCAMGCALPWREHGNAHSRDTAVLMPVTARDCPWAERGVMQLAHADTVGAVRYGAVTVWRRRVTFEIRPRLVAPDRRTASVQFAALDYRHRPPAALGQGRRIGIAVTYGAEARPRCGRRCRRERAHRVRWRANDLVGPARQSDERSRKGEPRRCEREPNAYESHGVAGGRFERKAYLRSAVAHRLHRVPQRFRLQCAALAQKIFARPSREPIAPCDVSHVSLGAYRKNGSATIRTSLPKNPAWAWRRMSSSPTHDCRIDVL